MLDENIVELSVSSNFEDHETKTEEPLETHSFYQIYVAALSMSISISQIWKIYRLHDVVFPSHSQFVEILRTKASIRT